MGKTVRFNAEKTQEFETKKRKKITDSNKNELSSKLRHGHFTKMHVWPVTNTKRKGRHKV